MVVKVKYWSVKRKIWFQKNDDSKLGKSQQYEDFILYGDKEEMIERLKKKGYNTKGATDEQLQAMDKDDNINRKTKRRFY